MPLTSQNTMEPANIAVKDATIRVCDASDATSTAVRANAHTEIRFAGFGGQGVILATQILGKAASIYDGLHATMTQTYGPEARGGACSAQLILSPEPILYPYTTKTDLLVAMSQEAYTRFLPNLKPSGILVVEEDLVRMDALPETLTVYRVPATRLAEELGNRVVQNVVMLCFLCARVQLVSPEALRSALLASVPANLAELNQKALQLGLQFGTAS